MTGFVKNANLPINTETIIIGEKYAHLLKKPLHSVGLYATLVPDNPYVDRRVSGHADLSVFHAGGEYLVLAPYLKGSRFAEQFAELGANIIYADIEQHEKYPLDAQLNSILVGNRLIYNKKTTANEIVNILTNKRGLRSLSSRQGYAACSSCVVDENSIITSDSGVAQMCIKDGMDVLVISPGSIKLEGFDCGFIGGCTFKISSDKLAFTGIIDSHPDKKRILAFLESHGIKPVFLTETPAFDIGGAIPITEKTT